MTLYDDMVRIINRINELEEEIAANKEELTALDEEIAANKEELTALDEEIAANKKKLATTKNVASLNALNILLVKQNRIEDIIKAAQDEEYCQQLMEELGV